MSDKNSKQSTSTLVLGAIGVVFGDIGTSPLYAIHETFADQYPLPVIEANILGVLSLMFWTIMLLISLKYVLIVMRADNRGEGGVLALLAMVTKLTKHSPKTKWFVTALGILAAALFYGDGMITPAISVLSAVEGLEVVDTHFKTFVIPITVVVITLLFWFQKRGTSVVGLAFGPIMVVWFACLAVLGGMAIAKAPHVLAALNPMYAYHFLAADYLVSFLALGG